jgi:carboxypeptidase PM20D1
MIVLFTVLGIIALLLLVAIVRAILFVPKKDALIEVEEIKVDLDKATKDLADMIKCKTISHRDREKENDAEFERFISLLSERFPLIYKNCTFERVSDRAILYHLKGKSSDAPSVFTAHFDVVDVEEKDWTRAPFCGEVDNGFLWGGGSLDTKSTLNASMQALEQLLSCGFVPENDIYLAFSGNEEINGEGQPAIIKLFKERGIDPALVLDEGGAVVNHVFPGVHTPCALIGIAEKGMLNVELKFTGNGGHSSSPKPHTPIGKLSAACLRIENHPFKYRLSSVSASMFDTLARYSNFGYKLIFANLWLFGPILSLIGKLSGGELNALIRTTCSFTQMEGSKGINVIPPNATMCANLRLIPGETKASAEAYLRKQIKDKDIQLTVLEGEEPSPTSLSSGKAWDKIVCAVKGTWDNTIVSPYLMFACSDAKHWSRVCDKVYRFSAMALTNEERRTIHGNDERISLDAIQKGVEFYVRLMKNC